MKWCVRWQRKCWNRLAIISNDEQIPSDSGLLLRHLRNEPSHNRDEDDRQDCDDPHNSSWLEAVRFGLAGFRQSFGQSPSIRLVPQDACGARSCAVVGRSWEGVAVPLSQPERPAYDRLEKAPSSPPGFFVSFHSHLILRK